jgi:hypothetical protein
VFEPQTDTITLPLFRPASTQSAKG